MTQQASQNAIRTYRKKANLSLAELAEKANASKSQIHKLERGERRLTVDWIMRLSRAMDCKPHDLLPNETVESSEMVTFPTMKAKDNMQRPMMLGNPTNLPVRGVIGNTPPYHRSLMQEPQEFISRPASLEGAVEAFAVYMGDSSMEPRYYAGETLYVKPNAPITDNCFVLVELLEGRTFAAQVITRSSTHVLLRQMNPLQDKVYPYEDVASLQRIIGGTEA